MNDRFRSLAVAASAAALLALGACGDRGDDAEQVGQPAQAGRVTEANSEMSMSPDRQHADQGPSVDTTVMGAAQAGPMDDLQIEMRVKSALAADSDLGALKIDVDSDDGVVTLRGTAPDPVAKERAAELVKAVEEVKSVDNQLTLG